MHQFGQTWTMHKKIFVILFFYIIVVFFFIHKHYLFYVSAFSATFKLFKTKFFILATHCTNKSKSAEPAAVGSLLYVRPPAAFSRFRWQNYKWYGYYATAKSRVCTIVQFTARMCARLCAFLKKDMLYNIKICYNAEKWMRYAICVQNLCRITSYLCNIEQ